MVAIRTTQCILVRSNVYLEVIQFLLLARDNRYNTLVRYWHLQLLGAIDKHRAALLDLEVL